MCLALVDSITFKCLKITGVFILLRSFKGSVNLLFCSTHTMGME